MIRYSTLSVTTFAISFTTRGPSTSGSLFRQRSSQVSMTNGSRSVLQQPLVPRIRYLYSPIHIHGTLRLGRLFDHRTDPYPDERLLQRFRQFRFYLQSSPRYSTEDLINRSISAFRGLITQSKVFGTLQNIIRPELCFVVLSCILSSPHLRPDIYQWSFLIATE